MSTRENIRLIARTPLVGCFDVPPVFAFDLETRGRNEINNGLPMPLKWHLYILLFFKF